MPARESSYDDLRARTLKLPGVREAPHRFGGTEFQLDGVEFMHSHGTTLLDIRLSKRDQESVLKNKEALPHRFAPQAGWVSFRIEKPGDIASAMKLVELAYDNAKRNLDDVKSRRGQTSLPT